MSPKDLPLVEPLESRIAPATVINTGVIGNPAPPSNVSYTDAPFHAESALDPNFDAGDSLGANFVGGLNTFYIKLSTGDRLLNFKSGLVELIKVKSGNVVAFFADKNGDNEVDVNELTGLSLGKGADVSIGGNVDGDIVGNFNDATGKIDATGAGLTSKVQTIKHIAVDNVTRSNGVANSGAIISGGAMTNVLGKTVNRILAGSAANGYAYDFNGDETLPVGQAGDAGGGATLAFVTAAKQVGSSITGVTLTKAVVVTAGDGGTSALGGGISKLTLDSNTDGITVAAGAGGAGAAGSIKGGNGGAVNSVLIRGLDAAGSGDLSDNSLISISGGVGGLAAAGGKGGAGGAVIKAFIGYDSLNVNQLSAVALRDNVLIQGGAGADGKTAGAGGALSDLHVRTNTPADGGVNPELQLLAGNGGDNTGGPAGSGKDGIGASILNVEVRNGLEAGDDSLAASSANARILVQAGTAGFAANTDGFGALGGSITNAKTLGFQVDFEAGDGSEGDQGSGAGGSLKTLLVEGANNNNIHAKNVTLNAGQGQSSSGGKAGAGGLLNGAIINSADLEALTVNSGTKADGGTAGTGKGAAGGAVMALRVEDVTFSTVLHPTGHEGTFTLRSGLGGDGPTGGGAGGKVSNILTVADNLDIPSFGSGNGGSATTSGKGGAAGGIDHVSLVTGGQVTAVNVVVNVNGGVGGDGMATGAGGAGATLQTLNVVTGVTTAFGVLPGGPVTEIAGAGGTGFGTGAAGAGGSINGSHGTSADASVTLIAGDAGGGTKPGKGGNILGTGARALTDVTITSGNGGGGGAGGNLQNIAFSNPFLAAPTGNIALTSGNGSAGTTAVGAGGHVIGISGYVSTGGGTTTKILAGNGDAIATKASAGGNVQDVRIFDGGGTGTIFTIDAGNAVAAASASKGGTGGNAKDILVFSLDPATNFHHVAAGNGGDTALSNGKGGPGGSVTNLKVNHDIGNISDGVTPSGAAFGYDATGATGMGGIFAGSGGINTTIAHTPTTLDPLDGAAGNVTGVTAEAIAAIVAGHPGMASIITKRNLVTKVDDITLVAKDPIAGVELAHVDNTGAYTNYVTANLVGAVVNPSQVGVAYPVAHPHANTFDVVSAEFVDNDASTDFSIGDTTNSATDGFIAAITLTAKKNFVPEAFLTLDGSGNSQFIDYTNGKATP